MKISTSMLVALTGFLFSSPAFACDYQSKSTQDAADTAIKSLAMIENQIVYTEPQLLGGVIEKFATYLSTAYDNSGKASVLSATFDTHTCELAYSSFAQAGQLKPIK